MATITNGTKYAVAVSELEYMSIIDPGKAADVPDDVACKWECRSTTVALCREGLRISIPQDVREAYQAKHEGRDVPASNGAEALVSPSSPPKAKAAPTDYANMSREECLVAMETADHHQTVAALRRRVKAIDEAAAKA